MNAFFKMIALSTLAFAMLGASSAFAQLPFSNVQADRPQISPYLSLLNTNGNGVNNYSQFVRPQLDAQNASRFQQEQIRSLQSTQQQLLRNPQGVSAQGSREIRSTGHETLFLNTTHFYAGRR